MEALISLWRGSDDGGKAKSQEHGLMMPDLGSLGWWVYRAVAPPATKVCGTPGGPPVTATRVRLRDGRHLAICEYGVPREQAKVKMVYLHGFTGCRNNSLGASKELMEELGVYIVGFDRPGYGESDPNPNRSVKSIAFDIEELADALELGPKFYLAASSIGNNALWGALKYIPHRLAGAALMAPVVNYWWSGFPIDLATEAYNKQEVGDQWALRVAHHAPAILHWWMAQSWLPTSTVVKGTTYLPNKLDEEIRQRGKADGRFYKKRQLACQQGLYESFYREMKVMFGKWEFSPMELPEPPFRVDLWMGDEDGLVPVMLQRHVAKSLPWIHYHELPGTGHFLAAVPRLGDRVLKTMLGHSS